MNQLFQQRGAGGVASVNWGLAAGLLSVPSPIDDRQAAEDLKAARERHAAANRRWRLSLSPERRREYARRIQAAMRADPVRAERHRDRMKAYQARMRLDPVWAELKRGKVREAMRRLRQVRKIEKCKLKNANCAEI